MQTYRAAVIGATGAVGASLVRELLRSPRCTAVILLARRSIDTFAGEPGAEKLVTHVIDMDRIATEAVPHLEGVEVAFCTMGVGQPSKVSKEEHWKVDVTYAAAFAKACKAAGVRHLSLLGSVGADVSSRMRYLNVKGAAEEALKAEGLPRVSLFRPSLLQTKEVRYGLADRLNQWAAPLFGRIMPSRYHGIPVEDLGRAMRLNAERPGKGAVEVLHYDEFQALLKSA